MYPLTQDPDDPEVLVAPLVEVEGRETGAAAVVDGVVGAAGVAFAAPVVKC